SAAVALQVGSDLGPDEVVVFVIADTGERYLSKFHSDEWMKEKRLLTLEKITIGLVAQLKEDDSTPHLVSVGPNHTVSDAIQLMNNYGLSQLPVLDEVGSVGSLREGNLMANLLGNRELMQAKVAEVMDRGFPVVSEDVGMESAVKYLRTSPALLIEEYGRIVGIITRHDVLDAQP